MRTTTLTRVLCATLGVAATIAMTGCNEGDADASPPERVMEVVIQKPTLMPVEDLVTAVGTIQANETVNVQPEVPGIIKEILFEEGQQIEAGTLLFRMVSQRERAAVAQARAELDLAQSNLDRAHELSGNLDGTNSLKAISQQELDQLESIRDVKQAVLDAELEKLAEKEIEAPISGTLGPRMVSPGQYVNAGTQLVRLVDDTQMKVTFRLPERQLGLIKHGQEGRLRVAAWPDKVFKGTVSLINPVIDPGTRTAQVRLIAPNPDRLLRPGMFARIELVVNTRPDSLVIPETALVPSLARFSVYSVEDGRAKLQPVELGVRLPGEVEIRSGLSPTSQLVVLGTQNLVDGMLVTNAPALEVEGTDPATL